MFSAIILIICIVILYLCYHFHTPLWHCWMLININIMIKTTKAKKFNGRSGTLPPSCATVKKNKGCDLHHIFRLLDLVSWCSQYSKLLFYVWILLIILLRKILKTGFWKTSFLVKRLHHSILWEMLRQDDQTPYMSDSYPGVLYDLLAKIYIYH